MQTKNSIFKALKESRKKASDLADQVAKAEAEVVIAEDKLATAKRDDGKISAEKLVSLLDEADRNLRIRQIESNRAAAKLEEAENEYDGLVEAAFEPLFAMLEEKAISERERLQKEMTPVFGEEACRTVEFNDFLDVATPIRQIKDHSHKLSSDHNNFRLKMVGTNDALKASMFACEEVL
jgi:hypothetical protein